MRAASAIPVLATALVAFSGTPGAGEDFPHYRAAQRAAESGDCAAVLDNLNAFLQANPQVLEPQHRVFYLRVQRVIGECDGSIIIRGIGDGPPQLSPLPDEIPAAE